MMSYSNRKNHSFDSLIAPCTDKILNINLVWKEGMKFISLFCHHNINIQCSISMMAIMSEIEYSLVTVTTHWHIFDILCLSRWVLDVKIICLIWKEGMKIISLFCHHTINIQCLILVTAMMGEKECKSVTVTTHWHTVYVLSLSWWALGVKVFVYNFDVPIVILL